MSYDGLDSSDIARIVGTTNCLVVDEVTSTLDLIHDMAGRGAPAGTVIVADQQTAGRGRLSRRWASPANRGTWLGYLVRPEHPLEGGVLAIRVGLAILDMLAGFRVRAFIKWPNDILVRNRKLAGVLCEVRSHSKSSMWVAVGIGINVHAPVEPELDELAIALDEVAPEINRVKVLEKLVPRLQLLSHERSLTEREQEQYLAHDWLNGMQLTEPLPGSACGIDGDGALLVCTEQGVERVVGGSVVTA